ncbi:MAG TPA: PAS domain S-box protein, partial [Holophaga sp.]|nr:PAS domain S-box protein [Holophaga sp.]
SEERFRTVADHTYDWEYWHDAEGRFVYSSPSCERITGCPPEDLPTMAAFTELILEEDRPRFLDHATHAMHGPSREEQRFRIRHRDGRVRWIGHVCKPMYKNGEFLGIRGSNRDITDQIQARAWLQESEERLRRIIDATQVGTWEWAIRTGEVVINERWAEIIGYQRSELTPIDVRTWYAHVHPDDRKASKDLLEKVFRRETSLYDLECRMRHKDGHWVWILSRGQVTEWGPDGEALSMSGTHTDIMHLKLAEEALRAEEERYRTILQTTLDGFCALDQQGRFIEVNSAFTRMSGYELPELMGISILDLEAAGAPESAAQPMQRLPHEGRVRFETRHRHKDGYLFDVEISMVGLKDTIIVFMHDITERKRSESSLKAEVDRLQAVLRVFQHEAKDRQSFLDLALGEAVHLTSSGIGCIHLYREDQGRLELNAWSRAAGEEAGTEAALPYCDPADTGLWDEVVRRRTPVLINSVPAGHAPLRNFLGVPIFYEDRIVAVASVANKETGYTERDVLQLTILMDGVWRSVMLLETFEVLKASENRYANLFNAIQEGFSLHEIVTDGSGVPVDYRFLAVNPAFEQLTGIPRDRWVGRTAKEVLPNLESRWVETYGRVALTGEPVLFEDYARALGRWYQVYAFSPGPRQFAVLSLDVTERKQADDKVRQSEANLRSLVESAPDPIFIQTDGRFAYVNPATCATLGARRPEDLLGSPVLDHVHPADREAIAARIEALNHRHSEMAQREDVFVGLDGRIVNLEVSAVPFRYEGREGALVFARDITARKALEAALVDSERFLRAAQAVGRIGSYRVDIATDRWEGSAILGDILGIDPTYPRDLRGWLDLVSPELRHELAEY